MVTSEAVFRSILNTLYSVALITSTVILYQISDRLLNNDETYLEHKHDDAFVIIYFIPSACAFIFTSAALTGVIINYASAPSTRHKLKEFHADIAIVFCWNTTFCCNNRIDEGLDGVSGFCDAISTNICMQIINITLLFITIAIISILLPIIVISGMFNHKEQIRTISMFFQTMHLILDIFLHLFSLNHYGYLSLIIIIASLLYIFIGFWIMIKKESNRFKKMSWFMFEVISLILMLTITFIIEYENKMVHIITIIAFVNYIIFNFPLFKPLLLRQYNAAKSKKQWTFILRGPYSEYNDMKHRMYCILHATAHDTGDKSIDTNYDSDDDYNEETTLLNVDKVDKTHHYGSMQCFMIQYEYLKASAWQQRSIMNGMHPRRALQILLYVGVVLWMLTSFISFFYPCVWFGYVWIYRNDQLIVNGMNMMAMNVFVWIINGLYILVAIYWLITFCAVVWTQGSVLVKEMMVLIFVTSLRGYELRDFEIAGKLFDRSDTVLHVLNAPELQTDIALIILTYLY